MPSIMCFGKGEKDDVNAKKSREIEKQLREDQKKMAREVKLLLLGMSLVSVCRDVLRTDTAIGAGESGKSTVLKQMRLIHTKGFNVSERKQWKVTIFQNLLHAFQVVFGAMEEQEVDFAEGTNIVSLKMLEHACSAMLTINPAIRRTGRIRSRYWPRRCYAIGLSERLPKSMERCRGAKCHQEG